MKARIGFVLFIFVFIIAAVVVPVIDRISRLWQEMVQYCTVTGALMVQGSRFFAKKLSTMEWKKLMQKAS